MCFSKGFLSIYMLTHASIRDSAVFRSHSLLVLLKYFIFEKNKIEFLIIIFGVVEVNFSTLIKYSA